MDGDRGTFFFFCLFVLELWSFRSYLGASSCTYLFLAHDVSILMSFFFFFYELYMIGGDIMVFFFFFFCHHHILLHWLLIYIYEVIHDIYLLFLFIYLFFMLYEIKNLFCFTCISTCVCVFVKCYKNIQVDSVMLLSTLATDRW